MDPILLSRSNFLGLITYGGNKLNFSFGRVRGGQRGGEDLNKNKHIYIFAFIPLHHHITIYSPLPCLQYPIPYHPYENQIKLKWRKQNVQIYVIFNLF